MRSRQSGRWLYMAPLLVVGIGMYVIANLHPYSFESRWWTDEFGPFFQNPGLDTYLAVVGGHFKDMFFNDNLRMAQLAGFCMMALPKWITTLAGAACLVCMLQSTALLAGVWRKNFLLFTFTVVCSVWLYPWYGDMYGPVMLFNYALPAALYGYTMWRWLRSDGSGVGGALILGFLTGWTNEAYAAMVVAGVAGGMLFFPRLRSAAGVAMTAGAIIPVIVTVLSPCFAYRSEHLLPQVLSPMSLKWWMSMYMILPLGLFLAALAFLPRFRHRMWSPAVCVVLFGAVAGAAVAWVFSYTSRTAWGMIQCGIILAALVAERSDLRVSHALRGPLSAAGWILVFGCYAISIRLLQPYKEMMDKADESRDPVTMAFTPTHVTFPDEHPVLILLSGRMVNMATLYQGLRDRSVYPAELLDFDTTRSHLIPTNLPGATLYQHRGQILGFIPELPDTLMNNIFISKGRQVLSPVKFSPYATTAGEMQLLYPVCSVALKTRFGDEPVDSIFFAGVR